MPPVVFEDEDFLVIDKPSGLLTVPGLSTPENLYDTVRESYPNCRVVHRLDQATSGLVIFALNYAAQRAMGKRFENREIQKYYVADIYGVLRSNSGEIHIPMRCDWENKPKQKVDWLNGKQAITRFETLYRNDKENWTRILLKPHTGRSHQLRVHMLALGHPILGDNFYFINGSQNAANRLHLHACKLKFSHPINNKTVCIDCPAPFV